MSLRVNRYYIIQAKSECSDELLLSDIRYIQLSSFKFTHFYILINLINLYYNRCLIVFHPSYFLTSEIQAYSW